MGIATLAWLSLADLGDFLRMFVIIYSVFVIMLFLECEVTGSLASCGWTERAAELQSLPIHSTAVH